MAFLIVILALILLLLSAGAITFFMACRRRKEYPWHNPEGLKNTPYEKHIELISYASNWLKAHNPQDIYITSEDGLRLHGLWIPAKNPKGTILLAHGYRSTMLVDFGKVLDMYHKESMNLLLPQQRSHGESEGKYITFGVKESRDMLRWIEYHNQNLSECGVFISGLSMGASTVMYMLDQNLPENVKAAICDCGFSSPAEIIAKVFRDTVHIPAGIFVRCADLFARLFAGFSLYEKDSRETLKHNKLPILIAHGLADDFVPCIMSQEAFSVCNGEKYLILAKDAGHGYSYMYAEDEYYGRITELIRDKL